MSLILVIQYLCRQPTNTRPLLPRLKMVLHGLSTFLNTNILPFPGFIHVLNTYSFLTYFDIAKASYVGVLLKIF